MELMEQNEYAKAKELLEESLRIESAVGTRFNLARCYEELGKTASAWNTYNHVADEVCRLGQQQRCDVARERVDELAPQLAHLKIDVPAPVPGLAITRNGLPVGSAQWGIAIPIDPEGHEIVATAPEHQVWKHQLPAPAAGDSVVVSVPALLPQSTATAPSPMPASPDAPLGGQQLGALVVGGIGVVAIGVGSAFGVMAMSAKSALEQHCDANNTCDQEGVDQRDAAKTNATVSTALFVVGAVAVASGVTLWLTAPDDATVGVSVQPRAGGGAASLLARW